MTDIEALPKGWATAQVDLSRPNGNVRRYEILDLRSKPHVRYRHEPMSTTAIKCGLLFIACAPYFAVYTTLKLIRLPISAITNRSPALLLQQLKKIALIPVYFIALECAAFYGIFKPLEGRAYFGAIETEMHNHSYKADLRYAKEEVGYGRAILECLTAETPRYALFAGLCMQRRGTMDDPKIIKCQILDRNKSLAV